MVFGFVGCKPAYSLIIILFIILLVLLIGLILLCCWRCCVYVIDRQEEREYNMDQLAKATVLPLLPGIAAGMPYCIGSEGQLDSFSYDLVD